MEPSRLGPAEQLGDESNSDCTRCTLSAPPCTSRGDVFTSLSLHTQHRPCKVSYTALSAREERRRASELAWSSFDYILSHVSLTLAGSFDYSANH